MIQLVTVQLVQDVNTPWEDMSTRGRYVQLRLENSVSSGQWIRLTSQIRLLLKMLIFLTGVLQQQRTTVVILINRGQKDPGATQQMQTCVGKHATFRCATVVR